MNTQISSSVAHNSLKSTRYMGLNIHNALISITLINVTTPNFVINKQYQNISVRSDLSATTLYLHIPINHFIYRNNIENTVLLSLLLNLIISFDSLIKIKHRKRKKFKVLR